MSTCTGKGRGDSSEYSGIKAKDSNTVTDPDKRQTQSKPQRLGGRWHEARADVAGIVNWIPLKMRERKNLCVKKGDTYRDRFFWFHMPSIASKTFVKTR